MLSRIAHSMFQLGQHIERAENITRVLDVNYRMGFEVEYFSELDVWLPMLAITHSRELFESLYDDINEENVYDFLLLSDKNPDSVLSRLHAAREAARSMRERISDEMWNHLNRAHLELANIHLNQVVSAGSYAFNQRIQTICNTFHGLAAHTMVHGKAWKFLRLGTFLDRALMSSRILEIKYHIVLPDPQEVGRPLDIHQWQALLRSVSAYEAYRRMYKARIVPAQVVNLVLFNADFPRSVRYCMEQVSRHLQALAETHQGQSAVYSQAESFLDELRGGKTGESILRNGLQQYLQATQQRCIDLRQQIADNYFELLVVMDEQGRELSISKQMRQQQQQGING
ncbi:MAG: alpha-E domain-containing protein [Mariprofundaceae bacterium]|nr:alpha-E domain-containing protein [Mariprofundaceae bacterium]